MIINIAENYRSRQKELMAALEISNVNALPKIGKVTVSSGVGVHRSNKEMMQLITSSLMVITGQKPTITKSKKAIAGFKLRQNEEVGFKVTLRGSRMNDFLNRLVNITLPRIREFKGVDERGFDHNGNLTLGFRDQLPFAELGHQGLEKPFGLAITLTVANSNPERSAKLLRELGFPLKIS